MKNKLTTLVVIMISVFAIATLVYAANNFPTSLNSYSDGDIIESDWANQLESRIGVTNSSVATSHDYKIRRAVSFDIRVSGGSFARVSSLSFDDGHFNISNTASRSDITLDWGSGGPASLSQAETITGNWVNTDNPWADNEVVNTLTIDGGVVTWTDLTTYPTGCSAGQFVSTIGDTLTCGTPSATAFRFEVGTEVTFAGVTSISFSDSHFVISNTASQSIVKLDWDSVPSLSTAETIAGNWVNTANPWADNEVIDALTVTGGVIGANSISGTQTTTGTLTIGDNGDSIIIDASNWDVSTLGKADFLSASVSTNFEAVGYVSASQYFGATLSDCDSNGSQLLWSDTGLFSCQTLADADIPDTITISGGTIGSNNISATSTWTTLGQLTIGDGGDRVDFATDTWDVTNGVFTGLTLGSLSVSSAATWTTLGTLTIGDNGDAVNFDTSTWDVSAGIFSGVLGLTATGDIDLGGAELEVSNGTSFTFDTVGEIFFDTTDFQIQIASAAANSPRVIPTMQKLWSASVASTSTEFLSGGRLPLPINRDKYSINEIHCATDVAATTVVINVSNMGGTFDTETVTCDYDGQNDTSIDTNSNYSGFTLASSSLEFGTVTGSPDWLMFSIWGLILPE